MVKGDTKFTQFQTSISNCLSDSQFESMQDSITDMQELQESVEKWNYKEQSYSFSSKTVTPFRNSKEPSNARQQAGCYPKLTAPV